MAFQTDCSSESANKTKKVNEKDLNLCENSEFKESFNKKLLEFYASQSGSIKKPWSKQRVFEVIKQIKSGKVAQSSGVRRTPGEYYWISKYDTIEVSGEDYLILKKSSADDPTITVIAMEDYFDLLLDIHKKCGHGGRDKMRHSIKDKYYVQIKAIEIFVSLCPACGNKRNIETIRKVMTKEEMALLVNLVQSEPVLSGKESNMATFQEKEEAWASVTEVFNLNNGRTQRHTNQLKYKWDSLKKAARKRAEIIEAGGEPANNEILDKVYELLEPNKYPEFEVDPLDSASNSSDNDCKPIIGLNDTDLDCRDQSLETNDATPTKRTADHLDKPGNFYGMAKITKDFHNMLGNTNNNTDDSCREVNRAIAKYYETKTVKLQLEIELLKLDLARKKFRNGSVPDRDPIGE